VRNGGETLSKMCSCRLVEAIFLIFFSSLSYAASVDTVINIESDSFEFYPREEKVKYEGSVETEYQGVTLQAERLEAYLKQDKTISVLIAYGDPVKIKSESKSSSPELRGTAGKIKLINKSEIIELSDQATLAYGKSMISSPVIRFNIKTGRIKAGKEGSRVSMTLDQSELE
jgi:lipopolysaccharide transport protein LptA